MKVIAILLLCLLVAGCGRGSAPDYDGRRGDAMLSACEAIAKGDDATSEKALQRLNEFSGADDFATSANLALQRKMNFAKAEKLLEQSDYQGLREFIASCRASGSAGTELDEFDSIPDAMEALSIFRSKMPWEDSKVLKDALEDLEPYREALSKSTAFVEFHKEQLETLAKLKAAEAAARADEFIKRLEGCAVSGNSRGYLETENDFRREQPQHPFLATERALLAGSLPNGADSRHVAIAAAANWKALPPKLREECAAFSVRAGHPGICGKLLNTLNSESLQEYESFLCAAHDAGHSLPAELVARYARMLGVKASPSSSPCTGIFEIGAAIKTTQTGKTK